jgi:hypothetical protein
MKKGTTPVFISLIIIFIIIMLMNSIEVAGIWGKGLTSQATLQFDIYGMENALEAADIYMDAAMLYSFTQAAYDVAKQGGLCEISQGSGETVNGEEHVYWYRNSASTAPTDSEILEYLSSCMNTNINVYSSESYMFMDKYEVIIQSVSADLELLRTGTGDIIEVSALSPSGLFITSSDPEQSRDIILKKTLNIHQFYDTDYFDLLDKGRDRLSYYSVFFIEIIKQEIDTWPTSVQNAPGTTYDEIFSYTVVQAGKASQTMEQASATISGIIENLPGLNFAVEEGSQYSIETSVVSAETSVSTHTTDTLDCVIGVSTDCGFSYETIVVSKVDITMLGEEAKVPVYNGERIAFEPPTLSFLMELRYTGTPS